MDQRAWETLDMSVVCRGGGISLERQVGGCPPSAWTLVQAPAQGSGSSSPRCRPAVPPPSHRPPHRLQGQKRVMGAGFPGHLSPPWPTQPALTLTCFTLSLCGIGFGAPGHEAADGEEAAASLTSTGEDGPVILIPGLGGVFLLQLLLGEGYRAQARGRGEEVGAGSTQGKR